jgi:hypothetical protein
MIIGGVLKRSVFELVGDFFGGAGFFTVTVVGDLLSVADLLSVVMSNISSGKNVKA